jgi:hypothetical protein
MINDNTLGNFRLRSWVWLCVPVFLASCSGSGNKEVDDVNDGARDNNLIVCPDHRPEICTKEYNPVCGLRNKDIRCVTEPCPVTEERTYATGCTACSDIAVISYRPGQCDED